MYEFQQDIAEMFNNLGDSSTSATLETINNFNELFRFMLNSSGRSVYIWGAGTYSAAILKSRLFEGVFSGVVDKNESLTGTEFFGLPVMCPDNLSSRNRPVILIASKWYPDIKRALEGVGYCQGKDFINIIGLYKGLSWMFNFCDLQGTEIQRVYSSDL